MWQTIYYTILAVVLFIFFIDSSHKSDEEMIKIFRVLEGRVKELERRISKLEEKLK